MGRHLSRGERIAPYPGTPPRLALTPRRSGVIAVHTYTLDARRAIALDATHGRHERAHGERYRHERHSPRPHPDAHTAPGVIVAPPHRQHTRQSVRARVRPSNARYPRLARVTPGKPYTPRTIDSVTSHGHTRPGVDRAVHDTLHGAETTLSWASSARTHKTRGNPQNPQDASNTQCPRFL